MSPKTKTLGPWKSETVKRRLQSEQVARERAAEVKYGQLEDENKDQNQQLKGQTKFVTRNETEAGQVGQIASCVPWFTSPHPLPLLEEAAKLPPETKNKHVTSTLNLTPTLTPTLT
jgi:hypothetical protein